MYKCKHFKLYELVDKPTYDVYGQKAWEFLDSKGLMAIDYLRDQYGPAIINDWRWGGKNQNRGLRSHNSNIGSAYSQHRFGRAYDITFKNFAAEEVREDIKMDEGFWRPYISRIENNVTWLHVDFANVDGIVWFNP